MVSLNKILTLQALHQDTWMQCVSKGVQNAYKPQLNILLSSVHATLYFPWFVIQSAHYL